MAGYYNNTNHDWKKSTETRQYDRFGSTTTSNASTSSWGMSTDTFNAWSTVTIYTCRSCGKRVESSGPPINEECPVEIAREIHDS